MTKSLARPRATAYARQSGRCFYCGLPMWTRNPLEFASKHNITPAQAKRLQCTGEHLEARQDGGSDTHSNIVAACLHCNQGRHCRNQAPPPDLYKQLVRKRMAKGRWHHQEVFQRFTAWPDSMGGIN